jgi:ribonuclease MRP protein subunit RMP1
MTTTHPTLDIAGAQCNLATSVIPIFRAFAHEHKNAHRTSRWWADFDLLRRHTAKLSAELLAPQRNQRGSTLQRATERARWLRDVCMPRAYMYGPKPPNPLGRAESYPFTELEASRSFSQLVADSQFAALGVLLLAVMADVHAAVGIVLQDHTEDHCRSAIMAKPAFNVARNIPHPQIAAEDFGEEVPREDAESSLRQNCPSEVPPKGRRKMADGEGEEVATPRKRRKKEGKLDEFDLLFSTLL